MGRKEIVVPNQPEIQVYVGTTGYIIIKQREWPEDDVNISIHPMHAEVVAKALLAAVGEAKEAYEEWKDEGDKDAS